MNIDELIAIDIHTMRKNPAAAARRRLSRFPGRHGEIFPQPGRRPWHAAHRQGDRRLLPPTQGRLRHIPRRCRARETAFAATRTREVAKIAAENSDMIPVPRSIRPRARSVRARRAPAGARLRRQGFKFLRPCRLLSNDPRCLCALRGDRSRKAAIALFHTGQDRRRRPACAAAWAWAQYFQSDPSRRRRRRLPRHADHPGAPLLPWQEEALSVATHKPMSISTSPAGRRNTSPPSSSNMQHAAQEEDAVRLRLAGHNGPTAGLGISRRSTSRDEVRPLILTGKCTEAA